jgi:hypothetical protein
MTGAPVRGEPSCPVDLSTAVISGPVSGILLQYSREAVGKQSPMEPTFATVSAMN